MRSAALTLSYIALVLILVGATWLAAEIRAAIYESDSPQGEEEEG